MKKVFGHKKTFLNLMNGLSMLLVLVIALNAPVRAEDASSTFETMTYETLQTGSRGNDVQALQEQLISLGFLEGVADGVYGNATADGVRNFQADAGLEETGIADTETQTAMLRYSKMIALKNDEEFTRAMQYGFANDSMAAEADSPITWKQFCEMAGRMIETCDTSVLPEWQKMTANAPEKPMKRDGGMMSLLFVAKAVNMHHFNAYAEEAVSEYAPRVWDCATMDYPVFPFDTYIDLGEEVSDDNYVGPAYDFCLRRKSCTSNKTLLEFDEGNDLRLEQDFTIREAVHAILRLYESGLPTSGYSIPESVATEEYDRAVKYGFIPEELLSANPDETVVTWRQYCSMIYSMLQVMDEEAAENWKAEAANALADETPMVREQGCVALYRALEKNGLALEERDLTAEVNVYTLTILDLPYDFCWDYYPLAMDDEWPYEEIEPDTSYCALAFQYCHGHISLVTGAPLFNIHIRINQPFTLRSAALSLVRSYESDEARASALLLEMNARFQAEVNAYTEAEEVSQMRARILGSETSIDKADTCIPGETYSGKAYYVSNNGDDENDGLSPETPWATIDRVRKQDELRKGDAVFFERGGFFRGNLILWGMEGVTISAYGEGAKPIITGSPENGAFKDKWTLVYEGNRGEKVWKFYKEMTDCGVIILDQDIPACKIMPVWTGNEWVNDDGTPYDPGTGLPKNHDFFSDIGGMLQGVTEFMNYPDEIAVSYGPLYLRCDEGNPGEMFESIEFAAMGVADDGQHYYSTVISLEEGSTLDNICVLYYPMAAAELINNGVVQNCEFAWGGGCMQYMEDGRVAGRMGDALCGAWARNCTVQGNYIHDIFTSAMIIEGSIENGDGGFARNITFADNLLVNNIGLNFCQDRGGFDNMRITGNIFLNDGHSWDWEHALHGNTQWATEYWKFIRFQEEPNNDPDTFIPVLYNNCTFSDNRFYYPVQFFLVGAISQSRMPEFADNTFYMADNSTGFACWTLNPVSGGFEPVFKESAESFLRDFLGDSTSIIVWPQSK